MKKKASWIIGMLSACAVSVGVAICVNSFKSVSVKAEDLFTWDSSVKVTKDVQATGDGLADTRRGTKLSSSLSGATVELAEDACGTFELDFRAYTATAYAGKEFSGNTVKNNVCTLQTMSLLFTDASNAENSFRIGIDGASPMNFATPQAYVELDGKKVGKYKHVEFVNGTQIPNVTGNTTGANAQNRYTALYGTSFSNKAYEVTGNESTTKFADTVESTVIGFDAYTGEVYAKAGTTKYTIWNVYEAALDGQVAETLDLVEQYDVALEFTTVAVDKTADIVLYSINGQNLSGESYTNIAGPNSFAAVTANAVKGEAYYLPAPKQYDVMKNVVTSTRIDVSLGEKTLPVYDANGEPTTAYSAGCYFTPDTTGEIVIKYTSSDATCEGAEFAATITAYSEKPSVTFKSEGGMEEGAVGVGTKVSVPRATVESDLFLNTATVTASVYKNGTVIDGYQNKALPFEYTLGEAGEYEIRYCVGATEVVKTYTLTANGDEIAYVLNGTIPVAVSKGDAVTFPTLTATKDSRTLTTSAFLYLPDGGRRAIGNDSVVLEVAGKYTVEYSVEGGYTKTYSVYAKETPTAFLNTTAVYGSNQRRAEITGVNLHNNSYYTTATYSEIIDLSASTKEDVLISFYNNEAWGQTTEKLPSIKIVDAHDPENYVLIHMTFMGNKRSSDKAYNYVQYMYAGAANQTLRSVYNGVVYSEGASNGAQVWYDAATAYNSEGGFTKRGINLSYDAAENALYNISSNTRVPIIDFDDTSYQTLPWEGFTTGEVYLELSNFNDMTVTQVYGCDFSKGAFIDVDAPEISLEVEGDELPRAVVGQAYPVLGATAVDVWSGSVAVQARVFRAYGTSQAVEVKINNGKFIPTGVGAYTVEYTATDRFGNQAVRLLNVRAVDGVSEITFKLESEPATTGTVKSEYKVPQITEIFGGDGSYTVEISAQTPSGESVACTDGKFMPMERGAFTLTYLVSDYMGNTATKTVNIDVTAEGPVMEDVNLPKYVLSGASLTLPAVSAVDYSSNAKGAAPSQTEIRVSGTSYSGKGTTVTATQGEMSVIYRATGSDGKVTEKTYTVTGVSVSSGKGFLANYFKGVAGSVTVSATSSGVSLSTSTSESGVQFINPTLASNYQIQMTSSNTDMMTVRLYDSADRSVSLRVDICAGEKGAYIAVNGGRKAALPESFFGFVYKQQLRAITDNNGNILCYITETENGEAFNGFASGKVWTEISFGTVSGTATASVTQLCNQSFANASNTSSDTVAPAIEVNGFVPKQVAADTTVTLPSATVQDVLNATATVTVKVSSNKLAASDATQSCAVTFDSTGTYTVTYTATSNGRSTEKTYTLTVVSATPPTVTASVSSTTVSKGTQVSVTASTTAGTLKIFLVDSNGVMTDITSTKKFTPSAPGTYFVRCWAYNSYGNYDMVVLVVTVS